MNETMKSKNEIDKIHQKMIGIIVLHSTSEFSNKIIRLNAERKNTYVFRDEKTVAILKLHDAKELENQVYEDDDCILMISGLLKKDSGTSLADISNNFKNDIISQLNLLNGSFNGFFYDKKNKKAQVFNDRFGHRFQYYCQNENGFMTSPTISDMVECKFIEPKPYPQAIYEFLRFNMVLGKDTLLKGVHRMLPATHIILEDKKIHDTQYYSSTINIEEKNDLDWVEEIDRVLKESAKNFPEKFRYIILLSGGLDSRVIAYNFHKKSLTYEALTHAKNSNDGKIANKVTNILNVAHKYDEISLENIIEKIDEFLMINDCSTACMYSVSFWNSFDDMDGVVIHGNAGDLLFGSFSDKINVNDNTVEKIETLFSEGNSDLEIIDLFLTKNMFRKVSIKKISETISMFNLPDNRYSGEMMVLSEHVRKKSSAGPNLNLLKNEVHNFFFDNNIFEMFLKMPIEKRYEQKLYKQYIIQKLGKLAKIPRVRVTFIVPFGKRRFLLEKWIYLIKYVLFYRLGKRIRKIMDLKKKGIYWETYWLISNKDFQDNLARYLHDSTNHLLWAILDKKKIKNLLESVKSSNKLEKYQCTFYSLFRYFDNLNDLYEEVYNK